VPTFLQTAVNSENEIFKSIFTSCGTKTRSIADALPVPKIYTSEASLVPHENFCNMNELPTKFG
jgi:hypothetical protein